MIDKRKQPFSLWYLRIMQWNNFTYMQHVDSRGGGGHKNKKSTTFQKLNQVNSDMVTPSTFQHSFYIHWTVQDCNKSYVLYNKGVATVGIEKKEECRKSRGSDSKQSLDLNLNMTNTSFSFYRLLYHNFLVSHLFWCRRMPFKSKLPHIKILSVFIQLYNFLHWV